MLQYIIGIVLCVTFVFAAPPKVKYDMKDVFIYDNKLIVEAKEFYVKGFNYSPQPLGMIGILANDGGGLCSPKSNMEGFRQSACYLEDYFDGNVNPDYPTHGPWFKQIWDRDFALMKSMGVNTVRVYHMHYVTKTLLQKYPDLYPEYKMNLVPEHRTFFDAAESYGIKVICPVVETEVTLTKSSMTELKRYVEARVDEVGNHPALLMWAVGNELGLFMKPQLRVTVNAVMDYVREYTLKKWNRIVPVTTVEVDLPMSYIPLVNEMRIDVFTSNCGYRDVYINSAWEWDTNPNNNMPGWAMISKYYGIPLLVGEFGFHEQDSVTAQRPDWINQQIKSMVIHKKDGGVGYLFFEWNEEHLKPPNQQDMGIIAFNPEIRESDGKDSTMDGVLLADKAIQKPVVFEAAKQGLPNSNFKDWTYNADVYQLTQTAQLTLDLNTVDVRPFPTGFPVPPKIPGFEYNAGDMDITCFDIDSKDPRVCSGRGTCIASNFCSCRDGYTGDQCEVTRQCYGIEFNSTDVCNNGGECAGPDSCICRRGYSGQKCETYRQCFSTRFDDVKACSGHGSCIAENKCSCTDGYSGEKCEKGGPIDSLEERPDNNAANNYTTFAIGFIIVFLVTPLYLWLS